MNYYMLRDGNKEIAGMIASRGFIAQEDFEAAVSRMWTNNDTPYDLSRLCRELEAYGVDAQPLVPTDTLYFPFEYR